MSKNELRQLAVVSRAVERCEQRLSDAVALRDELIVEAVQQGHKLRAVADVSAVTYQRVQQIVKREEGKAA